jgi:hypothetical protein
VRRADEHGLAFGELLERAGEAGAQLQFLRKSCRTAP